MQHIQSAGCETGVSTSRTCEMSLSNHSGIYFRSVLELVDRAAKPKGAKDAAGSESDAEAVA